MVMTGAGNTSKGLVEWEQDFLAREAAIADYGLRFTQHGSATAPSRHAYQGDAVLRCPLSADDNDIHIIAGDVIIEPQYGGPVIVRARLRTSEADNSSIFFGLSDANTESGMIIENEDGSLATAPADAVGFLLEGEQDETWNGIWVNGNADGDLTPLGHNAYDAKDDRWQFLQLNVYRDGTVRWHIDGKLLAEKSKIIDPTEEFCIAVAADARGTAYNLDLSYLYYGFPRRR